jgi:predicted MFS family arabinose efflux permease
LIFGFAARYVVSAYEYPTNYSYMFLIAGTSLLIASIGFWKLKEDRIEKKIEKIKLKNIFKIIKDLNKKDRNLFFYIIFLNLSAFSQTTIPFYIAYAKKGFGLTGEEVGNYIIFQVIGMIVATPIWYYISKNGSFKRIIKNCLILAAITPIYALLSMSFGVNLYIFTFLLTGFSLSARNIAVEGLLIEISQDDNRALYSGISGAFSIVSAIFPILSGIFISILGYNFIFILVSILVFSALLPLSKIKYSS